MADSCWAWVGRGQWGGGLENEGANCETRAWVPPDFIFWRLVFKNSSSNLTKCTDTLSLRARGPERGWERGTGTLSLDLRAKV